MNTVGHADGKAEQGRSHNPGNSGELHRSSSVCRPPGGRTLTRTGIGKPGLTREPEAKRLWPEGARDSDPIRSRLPENPRRRLDPKPVLRPIPTRG